MNIQDRRKTLTVEELRRRYNLDALDKDRKAIKLQKDQLTKVDAELNDFVEITTKNLKELQDQVDGNITTWFFNGVPKVENEPASNWTTDIDKNNHLGDLYYDQDTGYAYRWAYENNTYVWSKIVDADVVEALAVANSAQDTADSKRRVFVVQPKPPYDIGDIWIKEDTDLYRCRASRSEGNFNTADWIRATNYTDDTVALGTKAELDQFKTQVTENYVSNATLETTVNSITGKVEETYTYITTVENQVNDITTTTQTSTGDNNLYITDALESNALEYHIDGKSEQETILIDGYTRVEYLESTLYEYIDTGVKMSMNTKIEVRMQTTNEQSTSNRGRSGAILGSSAGWVCFGDYGQGKLVSSFAKSSRGGVEITYDTKWHTYYLSNGLQKIDDNTSSNTVAEEFNPQINIYLFKTNNNYDTFVGGTQRISHAKIWNNNTLVRDYIPCYRNSDNVAGLYDLVNNTFYTNAGTGTFTYGNVACLPSPDYPSEIKTIPSIRNLINPNEIISGGYSVGNGNYFSSETSFCTKYKIKIDNTKPYYLSHNVNNANQYYYVLYYDENENYLGHISSTITTKTMNLSTYSNYSKAKYINIRFDAPISYINEIQLEEDKITNYVPYGAWVKVKVAGKNILKIKDFTLTQNGITLKCENGVFKVSGTSTGMPTFFITNYVNINELNSMLSGKTLTISSSIPLTNKPNFNIGATGNFYWAQVNNGNSYCTRNLDSNTKISTVYLYFGGASGTVYNEEFTIQIEQSAEATKYEPYKEKEVLIDLNKPNLFDKDNANILDGVYIEGGTNKLSSYNPCKTLFIPCEANTTYTVEKILSSRFSVGYTSVEPVINASVGYIQNNGSEKINITTNANAKYLCVFYYHGSVDTLTEEEVRNSIKIYEGYEPYYELSSIGDTKDELSIIDGQVVIDKKIGKVVLNGSESNWIYDAPRKRAVIQITNSINTKYDNANFYCSHFKPLAKNYTTNNVVQYNNSYYFYIEKVATTLEEWKTWLSNNPVSLYYELAESEQIVLPNTNVELYEGVNHIVLADDLETTTSIKYLRKTPISGEYATNQQLGETNYNLANTTSKTNENTLNLNATNTNLNNNYYTKPQIDIMNTATTEEITTIKKEVETKITAEDLTIAINQIKTTGATSVETTTGYKFNEEGLSIQKSGSEMSSLLDNDGLVVKRNDTEMLTVRSSGVEAENITVRTYFTIGDNTRAENYKGGTGFFYIGGDD